jgi:hypothetical protein
MARLNWHCPFVQALTCLSCTYAHAFLQLLSRNPRTLREADFFRRESIDLSTPQKADLAKNTTNSFLGMEVSGAKMESKGRDDHL